MGFASLYPSYKTRARIPAARSARSDAIGDALEIEEGAGKAGCPRHPQSCAKMHTADCRCAGTPGLPCAMVLRPIPRSPRSRIPLASVADGLTIDRSPVWARTISASLTPATGARTTRLCRPRLPRPECFDRPVCCQTEVLVEAFKRRSSARRSFRSQAKAHPAINLRARRCRVHRLPRPTSVTIAIRPSSGCGMAGVVGVIWGNREAVYFCRQHWTKPCLICPAGNAICSSALAYAARLVRFPRAKRTESHLAPLLRGEVGSHH